MTDLTRQLVTALRTLQGQVLQARDGFGIWPYANSPSMAETLKEVDAALAAAEAVNEPLETTP